MPSNQSFRRRISANCAHQIRDTAKYLLAGRLRPYARRQFVIVHPLKLVYLNNPKSGSSTVKQSIAHALRGSGSQKYYANPHDFPWHVLSSIPKAARAFNSFTFVRNPFARLVSFYRNKFEDWRKFGKPFELQYYAGGVFHQNMSFEEVVDIVCEIDDAHAEAHFKSQYSTIFNSDAALVRHIWKLEDIDDRSFEIGNVLGIESFDLVNQSEPVPWSDYYNETTAQKVAARYAYDFARFGYASTQSE